MLAGAAAQGRVARKSSLRRTPISTARPMRGRGSIGSNSAMHLPGLAPTEDRGRTQIAGYAHEASFLLVRDGGTGSRSRAKGPGSFAP
jgi:hypothetical protein